MKKRPGKKKHLPVDIPPEVTILAKEFPPQP